MRTGWAYAVMLGSQNRLCPKSWVAHYILCYAPPVIGGALSDAFVWRLTSVWRLSVAYIGRYTVHLLVGWFSSLKVYLWNVKSKHHLLVKGCLDLDDITKQIWAANSGNSGINWPMTSKQRVNLRSINLTKLRHVSVPLCDIASWQSVWVSELFAARSSVEWRVLRMRVDCRRHTRSVLWPVEIVRVRRFPAGKQLLVPGRLRRPGQTVAGDDLSADRLQDQISRKLLPTARQPRVCQHQPHLRLLRRM